MPSDPTQPEPLHLICSLCGLGLVEPRTCSCCGDTWAVCVHCEAAHGRLVRASETAR
jgi:hypothetical protein